jgi:hypothetical protein
MGKKRSKYKILVGKPEGKTPLGRRRRRWDGNIKMEFQQVGCGGMDWIELAQNRDSWSPLMNCRYEHSDFIKCGEFLD